MTAHDPISELDAVVVRTARTVALDGPDTHALRSAMAGFAHRHVDLLDLLAAGATATDAVTAGLVGHWPEQAEVADGLPRYGVELLPVAHAVLDAAADRDAVVRAAGRVASHLGSFDPDELELVELVALEAVDALVLWQLSVP